MSAYGQQKPYVNSHNDSSQRKKPRATQVEKCAVMSFGGTVRVCGKERPAARSSVDASSSESGWSRKSTVEVVISLMSHSFTHGRNSLWSEVLTVV